jgi:hypothetical protein
LVACTWKRPAAWSKPKIPSTGSGTQIDENCGFFQEVVLLVDLDELESSSGSKSLLFGDVVELVQTMLGLLFLSHLQLTNIDAV